MRWNNIKRMKSNEIYAFIDKYKEDDYKEPEILKKYINEKGKILPRRVTGACSKHQRHIAQQIKRARMIALLPFSK